MLTERIQRQVERLLDEAETAVAAGDWTRLYDLTRKVLALDPDNLDARAFAAAAERGRAADLSAQAAPGGPPAAAPPPVPRSGDTQAGFGPRAYTPHHLAERILRDRAALEGERKQVTVLFCDFANSTPLADRLGPEGMHHLLNRFFELALAEVHRYEGTVNQFLGDGFMALFGAPVAHEDHARRAVLAALGLGQRVHEEWPEDNRPRLRMGVNSGPVVVGAIGDNLRMDYTAIGDTTNLAARMEQAATPGAVYLTEQTFRLAGDYIDCEPVGPLTVKGKPEPVTAWRAVRKKGIRNRIEAAATRGLTPLVSRTHELSVLKGYAERAAQGRGQVVFITGEAGIGKSRLLLEFHRTLAPDTRWLEGHCISYGRTIPYLPVIDILKGAFGIEDGDDEARIIARVDAGTENWQAPARATAPYLKFLLSVDPGDPAVAVMDPLLRRAGIFDALRAALAQVSRSGPTVLAIEDLHWVDERSEEALSALLDVVAATPVLLLLTARPGYHHSLGERSYFSRLPLGHLSEEESGALAGGILGTTAFPDDLQRLIAARAEGNPFFIEEVTRSLLETGALQRSGGAYRLMRSVGAADVPDTIQEVIQARIDRLAPSAKESMQLAAVIGREFAVRLLRRVSDLQTELDDLLGQLKTLELIYETAYFPELAYMFKHALTHDVAYATLLTDRRRALHRTVAAAIEELYADRLAEQYETLAHHSYEGEDWLKALDYLMKAGDKAAAVYANAEALDFYDRALAVCEKLGHGSLNTAVAAAQRRGAICLTTGRAPSAINDFNRMLAAARSLQDRHAEGMALALRAGAEFWHHAFDAAKETSAAALAIADEGHADVRLLASYEHGRTLLATSNYAEVEPLWQAVEAMAATVSEPYSQAGCGHVGGLKRNWSGHFDAALEHLERWRGIVQEGSAVTVLLANHWTEGLALAGKGEYEQALAILQRAIATADRVGEVFRRTRMINSVGWIYGELQDHMQSMEWNTRGIKAAQEMNAPDPECESNARLNLGDSLLALGRLDEAEEHFRVVERIVRNPRPQDRFLLWRYSQHFFHSYGELSVTRGDIATALTLADECLALAEQTESRKNIVKARRLRGQVFLAQRKTVEAERELDIALEVALDVGNPPQIWQTLATLGELRAAQGRADEARSAYHQAWDVIETVASRLADERLRTTFLSAPPIQSIRRGATEHP